MKFFHLKTWALALIAVVAWTVTPTGFLHAACTPPPDGLVSWWPGEGNALDSVGNGNGTLMNGTSFATGKVGGGFNFDGANNYVLVNSTNLNVGKGAGFSVEGWIKPANITVQMPIVEYEQTLGSFNGSDVGVHFYISVPPSGGAGDGSFYVNLVETNGTTSHAFHSNPNVVTAGVWQHVALTYDRAAGVAVIYLNGSVVLQTNVGSFTPQTSFTNLLIGARTAYGSANFPADKFSGQLDELSLYSRALSSNEVANIFAAGSAGKCSSSANTCTPPPDGLVSWWPGEGNASDANGTNAGALLGGATYAAGKVGQGFRLDGTNAYVAIPDTAALRPANVTAEAWVWLDPNVTGARSEQIIFKRNSWTFLFEGYSLLKLPVDNGSGTNTDRFQAVVSRNGNQVVINSTTAVQRGIWYHVATTYDGNRLTLFVNGAAEASAIAGFALDYDTLPVFIGTTGEPAPYRSFLAGIIDEPSIYNRALNTNEIAAIFNAGAAGKCGTNSPPVITVPDICTTPPAGLVAWWPGESSSADVVGTNYGTLVGGASYVTGEVGQGFNFNGAGGYLKIPQAPSLNVSNQLTVEFWMKADPTNAMNSYQGLVTSDFYGIGIANGYVLGALGVNFHISTDAGGAGGPGSYPDTATVNGGGAVVSAGQWHHVAGTYDGAKLQLYIDGQPWGAPNYHTGAISPMLANSFLTIGSEDGRTVCGDCVNNRYFNGQIDEPAIYNRALSTNEILAIYQAGSAGKCAPITPPPASLIVNGSFENPPGIYPYYVYSAGTSLPGWVVESGTVEITGTYWQAAEGTQSLDLNGIFDEIGTIYQDVPTVPGQNYKIRFAYSGNPECGSPTLKTANAFWNGTLLTNLSFDITGHTTTNLGWVYYEQIVTASSTNSRLRFQATSATFCGLTLDDVSVTPTSAPVIATLVDNSTAGYYNEALGTILDGTAPQFPLPLGIGTDSTIYPADEPVLTPAAAILGSWLTPNSALNSNWLAPAAIPTTWTLNTETAILYEVNGGTYGFDNLRGDFDADNGLYVWVNGQFKFGARAPGLPSPVGQFEYTNVNLGTLLPGPNRIQILREDSGISTGYQLRITGQPQTNAPVAAPFITEQPTNFTVTVNGTATFHVGVTGSNPLAYQWNFNGTNILGANTATLILSNVASALAGNYSVSITNFGGAASSSNALLTVYIPPTPPTLLAQSPSQVILLGSTATFHVTVSGTDPLSYFWKRDNVFIGGATNAIYSLVNAQLADSGSQFSCLITNLYGTVSSTNVTLKVLDTLPNDLCSGAILITNASYTNAQSTVRASSFGDPQPACVPGFGNGVWYQFTAPVSGWLVVDTAGSDFDTGLGIYVGACESLTPLACNDDTNGPTAQINFPTSAGTTYFILVGGYGAHVGNLVLHLNHFTPPAFDVSPTNLSVVVSSNATFTASISGTQPISLQWYFNNGALTNDARISGVTNATLNLVNITTNDGGNYYLVASNFVGVTTSSVAVLTPVILPPVIILQPSPVAVLAGSNVNFTALVAGTPPFAYQWYFWSAPLVDDGHFNGANTPSLTISNVTAADGGSYALVVTNVSGSDTSLAAMLTVLVPPSLTLNPLGRSVPPGLPTTFTATATGNPTPVYQWQLNGTNIPGATSKNYTNPVVSLATIGNYQVIASNTVSSATSSVAQLTFGPVAAWGRNLNNECLPPPGLSNVIAVAGTFGASYAAKTDGSVVAWGGGTATNVPASATNVVALAAAGANGVVALRADGTAVGWNNSTVPALSNIVAVASGWNSGVALRAEGTIATWGNPNVPAGLMNIKAVASGYTHSLALRSDGTVVAWGAGAGTNVSSGATNVVAIAAGYNHSLALKADGRVVAWGSGINTNLPAGLTNITAIAASGSSQGQGLSLAIRANGSVVVWGDNAFIQTTPPSALSNLISVALGASVYHALALVNDGSPQIIQPPVGLTAYTGRDVTLRGTAVGTAPLSYQWQFNSTNLPNATNSLLALTNLQLANAGNYQLFVSNALGTAISLAAPVNVISNNTLVFLSQTTNNLTNYQGSKITTGGFTVLGNGPLRYQWFTSPTNRNYLAVAGATNELLVLEPALAVQSGNYYLAVSNLFAGLTSSPVNIKVQFAKAWGFQAVSNPPVNVTNAIALATGGYQNYYGHYLALGADGKLTAWGNLATTIYGETNVSALSNSIVTAIAAGPQHSLALKSDGTVYAWGAGATNPPTGLNGVTAIACGDYHDLALKSDGTIAGWIGTGQFNYGQATNHPAATNVVTIAAGATHSLALRADGSVVSWGDGRSSQTTIPFSATNVIALAAGNGFSAALRANGTVVQWGSAIGNYPVPANLSNVVALSASGTHCTALRNDGSVVSWGYQYVGNASNNVPADLANVSAINSGGDHDIALFGTRAPAFTVQPWNRAVTYNTSVKIMLTGKSAGVQPVSYQWRLNGTNLPGATSDSLILTNQPFPTAQIRMLQPGTYQLVASNSYGIAISKPAKVTLVIPLGDALDTPIDGKGVALYNWLTSGNAQWFGQTNITHDGLDAARSGGIGGSQETILQTTVGTNLAGSYQFWWKVSSEDFFDTLEFRVNGTVQASISGEQNWQLASVPVPPGTNVLQWRYAKDFSYDAGLDAAFVDQFTFVPGPPVILTQPQPAIQTVNLGDTISLNVTAAGAPQLKYLWTQNGMPVGGNSPTLVLNNVARAQIGTYSVTITNAGGLVVSSNAIVRVLVPQNLGTPTLLPDGSLQLNSSDANGGLLTPADLANFEAQASTDLVNWTTLTDGLSLTNGLLQLQDATRTNFNARYYRIVEH